MSVEKLDCFSSVYFLLDINQIRRAFDCTRTLLFMAGSSGGESTRCQVLVYSADYHLSKIWGYSFIIGQQVSVFCG